MSRDQYEFMGGGLCRDAAGRQEFALKALHDVRTTTEEAAAGTTLDEDGREEIVLRVPGGVGGTIYGIDGATGQPTAVPGGGGGGTGTAISWYDFTSNLYPVGASDWAAGFSGSPQIGVLGGLIFFRGSIQMIGASGQGVTIVDSPFGALPSAYRPTANRFMNFETSTFSNDPDEAGWQGSLRLGNDGHLKLFTTLSTLMRNGARRPTSGFEPDDTILLDGLFCAV